MVEQIIKKRVVCLYRVSTVGQVEKDDIPMQKQYCREFTKRQPDWEIVKEFSEKGVSGFKISAKDRDAIQEIQKMALQGEFDILLVFMFDRLGRRDDETPLVNNIFCGHCGGHLILYTSGQRYKRKDGTIRAKTYGSYQCSRRLRRPGVCDGQACYSVAKVDNLVDQIVRIQFERIKQAPPQALIKQR